MEHNWNNLYRINNEENPRIHAMDKHYSEVLSISNTFKKLWIHSDFHLSYIKTIYNDKVEILNVQTMGGKISTHVQYLQY